MTLSIHARATHYGSRTAVIDHDTDTALRYDDLAAMAEEYAAKLAARGVTEGDAVCVLSRNRPELLGLFYAAVDLGAVLAPVSHRLPADAVETLRDRIDPALTLHEPRFEGMVGPDATTLEAFDSSAAPDADPDRLEDDPDPERPLLYLHTGGTTGVPKVVVIRYRQIEWNCITEVAAWGLGKEDVSPVLLPLFHTGGWHLLTLPTLYAGGRIVLHREFDPAAALESIESHGATRVFGVAAIFQAMADHDRFAETDLSSVDWFMSGGGPTPVAVMDAYRDRGQRFTQGYGLTEGGPNNLYFDPDREDAAAKAADSVGKPFPDCEVRIVDETGDPVAVDEVGELELSGPVAANRYLETDDGTFGGGWVSTGDLAYRDADGDLYITGRTDNMFVSGGENVYPEEIEDALERRADVAAAGVVGVPHERWGTVPKAVVVPADGGGADEGDGPAADTDDLEAHCRAHLADFQVPRAWEIVDSLPRSGPGKLDRGALESRYGVTDPAADEDRAADGGGEPR